MTIRSNLLSTFKCPIPIRVCRTDPEHDRRRPNQINTHRHWAGRNKHRSKGRISVHFSINRKQTVTRHEQNPLTNLNYISSLFRISSIRKRQKPSQAPQTPHRSNLLCTTVQARPWLCCVLIWIKTNKLNPKSLYFSKPETDWQYSPASKWMPRTSPSPLSIPTLATTSTRSSTSPLIIWTFPKPRDQLIFSS